MNYAMNAKRSSRVPATLRRASKRWTSSSRSAQVARARGASVPSRPRVRSATCRASTRVAAHSGDADETLLGRYVSDRRAVPFPLLVWGRRRSPLSMPAPVPAGGARAGSVGSRGPACHLAWRGAHGPGVGSESARSTRAYTNYAYKAKRSGQMCTHRRWWCL